MDQTGGGQIKVMDGRSRGAGDVQAEQAGVNNPISRADTAAHPGGAPGSQRSAIGEVARTAKVLTEQLQNLAKQRFSPIFPF